MFTRTENGISYTQQWGTENRLSVVTNTTTSPQQVTKSYYNDDGTRVKKEELSGTTLLTTTLYAGMVEVISATARITKTYYSAGAQLIALREISSTPQASTTSNSPPGHYFTAPLRQWRWGAGPRAIARSRSSARPTRRRVGRQ